MEEEPVPERFLDPPGGSHEEASPNISEPTDRQGQGQNLGSIDKKVSSGDPSERKIINGMLDDTGDEELKGIDDYQAEKSQQDSRPVLEKVTFESLEGLHTDNTIICYTNSVISTNPYEESQVRPPFASFFVSMHSFLDNLHRICQTAIISTTL